MKQAQPSPFADWRLLIAHSDEKTVQRLEALFAGRVASVECVTTGGAARSRIADTFARAIKLILLDYRLVGEKDAANWNLTLKNSLAKPSIILLVDSETAQTNKLSSALGSAGQLNETLEPAEFIKGFVRIAAASTGNRR